jgi:hypothetical protein
MTLQISTRQYQRVRSGEGTVVTRCSTPKQAKRTSARSFSECFLDDSNCQVLNPNFQDIDGQEEWQSVLRISNSK